MQYHLISLVGVSAKLEAQTNAVQRIMYYIDIVPVETEKPDEKGTPSGSGISFVGASMWYRHNRLLVFKNNTFSVTPGEKVALAYWPLRLADPVHAQTARRTKWGDFSFLSECLRYPVAQNAL